LLGINLAQLAQKAGRNAPELAADAEEIQETVQQLHREIRTTSYLLHPPLLDESGLYSAISWYVQGLQERSGLEVRLDCSEKFGRLPRDMELVIFRLVQECLTNIHRHSDSKSASIRLTQEANQIVLEVRDEGKGMAADRLAEVQSGRSGVGITGMRERLRQFEGTLEIESGDLGTRVFATIPVAVAKSASTDEQNNKVEPSQTAVSVS
jgi:signal transduction histidine kinase